MFFIVSITKICFPLVLLLAVGCVRKIHYVLWKYRLLKRSVEAEQEVIDKIERIETLIFALPLTSHGKEFLSSCAR